MKKRLTTIALATAGFVLATAALTGYTNLSATPANADVVPQVTDAGPSTHTYELYDGLQLTVDGRGNRNKPAVLVLHGGGGPRTVSGLSAALSTDHFVISPTHPGFDGTPRPDWMTTIPDLAEAYLDLIEQLHIKHVTVIGSSFGGWIASEMALRDIRHRISGVILIDAVAIAPEPPIQIADPSKLGPAKKAELAFYNPAFRPDPSKLTEAQKATAAANAVTTALYSGPTLSDPKLRRRLHRVIAPVLVVAGEEDGIAPLPYQRTLAASFPHATFAPIPQAGHLPHIEQPTLVLAAINKFFNTCIRTSNTH